MSTKCCYGCDQPARFGLADKRRCSENVSQCPAIKQNLSQKAKDNTRRLGYKNKQPHPFKGKTYTEIFGKKKGIQKAQKMSDSLQGFVYKDHMTTEAFDRYRKSLSDAIKRRYENGWEPKAGRCKKISYVSPVAGEIKIDGSWELEVAKYLDQTGVRWTRNKNRFAYFFDSKDRLYIPDFFIEDHDCYVEVKGYETDKDRSKWSQFPHKLLVLKKAEIIALKKGKDVLGWMK